MLFRSKQLLAGSLTDAYIEKKKDDISSKEEIDMLKHNLFLLFENADNLKKTFKALRLFTQSAFNYLDSSVITDVRPLFNDDLESTPTCGVILHQLKIEYEENDEGKSFYVSLNRDDVSELIDNLQRALKKEEVIKLNQTGVNFIELKK